MQNKRQNHIPRLPRAKPLILIPFVLILALASAVFLLGLKLLVIYPWSAGQLLAADALEPCDLIVFLGGTYYERIDYAFDLAEQGYSNTIYAPHVGYKQTRERILLRIKKSPLDIHFFQGRGAASTYEEALLTSEFIKRFSIKSLLLVTSPYHSLRAAWIFRKIMPRVKIISAPCCLQGNALSRTLEHYYRRERRKFLWYYLAYAWRYFDF